MLPFVKNKNYHRQALKTALVAEAIKEIASGGVSAFSLRGCAASLGVSHNAAYRHFPSKEALLAASRGKVEGEFTAFLKEAIQGKDLQDVKTLAALGEAYVRFFQRNPAYFRFIYENGSSVIAVTLDPSVPNYPPFQVFQSCCLALIAKYRCGEAEGLTRLLRCFALVQGLSSLAVSENVLLPMDFDALMSGVLKGQ
jgi:AcrR family transcriptional regulator